MKNWAVWILSVAITGILLSGCALYWEKGRLVRCPKCGTVVTVDDLPGQKEKRQ